MKKYIRSTHFKIYNNPKGGSDQVFTFQLFCKTFIFGGKPTTYLTRNTLSSPLYMLEGALWCGSAFLQQGQGNQSDKGNCCWVGYTQNTWSVYSGSFVSLFKKKTNKNKHKLIFYIINDSKTRKRITNHWPLFYFFCVVLNKNGKKKPSAWGLTVHHHISDKQPDPGVPFAPHTPCVVHKSKTA